MKSVDLNKISKKLLIYSIFLYSITPTLFFLLAVINPRIGLITITCNLFYYIADLDGNAFSSDGTKFNIKDREYFQELLKTKKYVFSKPILNTIGIFNKISSGNLTERSTEYVPDEFGEIIRYLNKLINILGDTVSLIMLSAQELEKNSITLSNGTVKLASGLQNQCAQSESSQKVLSQIEKVMNMVINISEFTLEQTLTNKYINTTVENINNQIDFFKI